MLLTPRVLYVRCVERSMSGIVNGFYSQSNGRHRLVNDVPVAISTTAMTSNGCVPFFQSDVDRWENLSQMLKKRRSNAKHACVWLTTLKISFVFFILLNTTKGGKCSQSRCGRKRCNNRQIKDIVDLRRGRKNQCYWFVLYRILFVITIFLLRRAGKRKRRTSVLSLFGNE